MQQPRYSPAPPPPIPIATGIRTPAFQPRPQGINVSQY